MNIGCHLSVGDGYLEMGTVAKSIGANTFQFFTRNPRGGGVKPINTDDMADLCQFLKDENFAKIIAHAPFVVNLSAKEESKRNYAVSVLEDDIMRMELLPCNYYNLHPGCHVGQGVDVGIEYVSEGLNKALYKDMTTTVLLETMAGVGTELGRNFEELKAIYDRVELKEKLGFCLDTCHIFDGGYDIVGNLDNVIEEFDRILGIENLKAVHLNDSKNPLGSHKDRHEKIGQGNIGTEAIVAILSHPALCKLPFVLETPNEVEGYAEEIKLLKSLVK